MIKDCRTCKHAKARLSQEPCASCFEWSNFTSAEEEEPMTRAIKEGDKVRLKGYAPAGGNVPDGAVGTVEHLFTVPPIAGVKFDEGFMLVPRDQMVLVSEEQGDAEEPPTKFKAGDKVKLINTMVTNPDIPLGAIGVIEGACLPLMYRVQFNAYGEEYHQIVPATHLERVDAEELSTEQLIDEWVDGLTSKIQRLLDERDATGGDQCDSCPAKRICGACNG